MKKFFYMAVAAIAALSSCSSDDAVNSEGGQNETGVTAFTATIEGGNTTRATYDATSHKAAWEADIDKISVDGALYTADSPGTTTTFTGSGATKGTDDKYHAYFPATLYSSTSASLPATLPLEVGKFNMPMYAESTTTSLSFKNLCGVLAITVPAAEMTSVKSIVVSSDKQMNGEISSITEGGVLTFASASPTDAQKKVTLTATSAVSTAGKTFYVPVPANTHNPLLITISDGTETKAMITKKAGGVEVKRSAIYPISFKENTNIWENALQLGKNVATSIVIETDVPTLPIAEDGTHKMLNNSGIVWEVLEGATLSIVTSAPKIIGNGPLSDRGLFEGYKYVTTITGLENVDFSEVTDMRWLFYGCNALTGLNLSSLNTSKVTTMRNMFFGCNTLTSLDLSNFDTSNVTNIYGMFGSCSSLNSLNLSTFNTSKVTDMGYVFYQCYNLKNINLLGSFNTSKVTSMLQMFDGCRALTSLDLTNFNTSEVTNVNNMFRFCEKLQTLNLSSSFVMTKVSSKVGMFYLSENISGAVKCKVYGAAASERYALSNDTYWSYFMEFAD